ncbi:alpha/beta hydrolase family protein [Rhodococcus jostii]|uniref:Secretory lipase n=1 Tax=Rhodococcus jostii TaxID=132919 RepID=A0A1H5BIZ4_RHOJO|nr:lipase family protein [Rhodococcus jostii]SED54161.1 Secretory lipase [Rhodococcus jostii]
MRVLGVAVVAVLLLLTGANEASAQPGILLSQEELPPAAVPSQAGESVRVRYSTLRTATAAGESTGSIFLPRGDPPDGGWPVVSYAHGTVGVADQCAPSVAGFNYVDLPAVEQWLAAGYAVAATDYAGIGTPGVNAYLDGHAAGANAVDIVLAAHELYEDELSDRWIVTGLSQGGHATYFAARDATARAPALDYRGAVAVAPPTHLELLFPAAGPAVPGLPTTGIVNYALLTLAGIDDQRPEVGIRGYLSPTGIELMELAKVTCSRELGRYLLAHPTSVGDLFAAPLWSEKFRTLFREMQQAPVDGFDRPLRVVHSLSDASVPIPLTWAQLTAMREHGVNFEYQQLVEENHRESLMASMPESLAFADRVLSSG